MRKLLRIVFFSLLCVAILGVKPSAHGAEPTKHQRKQLLYLAAGNHLTTYRIDPATGQLDQLQSLPLAGAGPFTFSPSGKRMYAVARLSADEGNKPAIATLDIQSDGQLKLVTRAAIDLRPGYLMTDKTGAYIAGNHYGPGKATVWKLRGGVYKGDTVKELTLEQRAHSAVFSPDNRWLLVPATGPNKVFIHQFNAATGEANANTPPFAMGPQGENDARQPRHLIFHPNLPVVYTTNERELPGVGVWKWDAKRGTLKTIQNIVSLPTGFEGRITTADLHLTRDGKYLYISNRDGTNRNAKTGRDSIVGFKVDPKTGRLSLINHNACERIPRSFCLDGTDRYVYVAGQGDDRLGAYRIDADTGKLSKVKQYEVGSRPIWVEALILPVNQ